MDQRRKYQSAPFINLFFLPIKLPNITSSFSLLHKVPLS